jgi:hypothetical protein
MRRIGYLFDELTSAANLLAAFREFRRGKRSRPAVRAFAFDAVRRLVRLGRDLVHGAYEPGPHRCFVLREPKRRLISVAAVRDRVVHHALHRVLAPRLDPGLSDHCFACLPGRGVQRAVLRFQRALRAHRFVLLLDVRAYFPSIVPDIVLGLMARRIKDARVLGLCATILEAGRGHYDPPERRALLGLDASWPPPGRGLPIGNLTSQWWGNHYLAELDHLLVRTLRLPHAQRYMDDIAMFADDEGALLAARDVVGGWLLRERSLRLKQPGRLPIPTGQAVRYLGRRVSRRGIEPVAAAWPRMQQRIAAALRYPDPERVQRTLASYRGILGLHAGGVGETADDSSVSEGDTG